MSAEWRRALFFSLFFHLFLGVVVLVSSWPQKAKPPQVIKLRLKSASLSKPYTGRGGAPRPHPISKPKPKSKPKEPPKTSQKLTKSAKSTKKLKKTKKKVTKRKTKSALKRQAKNNRKKSLSQKKKLARKKASRSRKTRSRKKTAKSKSKKEEKLLQQRLAALKAKAEEKALAQRLAALKSKKRGAGGPEGLSLSGGTLSEALARRLTAHLKSFWAVPEILKDKPQLSAEVELHLAPDGHILNWRFLRSSGNTLFDEAVRKCLKQADPLPAPGRALRLPVVFRIEE